MFQSDLPSMFQKETVSHQEKAKEVKQQRHDGTACFKSIEREKRNVSLSDKKTIPKKAPDPGYYRVNYARIDADPKAVKYVSTITSSRKTPDKTEPNLLDIRIKDPEKGFVIFKKQ